MYTLHTYIYILLIHTFVYVCLCTHMILHLEYGVSVQTLFSIASYVAMMPSISIALVKETRLAQGETHRMPDATANMALWWHWAAQLKRRNSFWTTWHVWSFCWPRQALAPVPMRNADPLETGLLPKPTLFVFLLLFGETSKAMHIVNEWFDHSYGPLRWAVMKFWTLQVYHTIFPMHLNVSIAYKRNTHRHKATRMSKMPTDN